MPEKKATLMRQTLIVTKEFLNNGTFFSEGAQSTVLVVLLVSYFGRSNVGGLYGLNRALTVVGFSAGPMIAGIAYDMVGSYFMVFWAFLILTLIGIALIINAKQSVRGNS